MTETELFFHEHAGFSYDPQTETPDAGRRRTATKLAAAEQWAKDQKCKAKWRRDEDEDRAPGRRHRFMECIVTHPDGREESLCGIEILKTGTDPYKRVVEAELASELMG